MHGYDKLPERSTLVLTSLAGGVKHGYALIQDIESFAGTKLAAGTLYGALSRLQREGMIAALPADERRLPYRITKTGADALTAQLSANAHLARVGLARVRQTRG